MAAGLISCSMGMTFVTEKKTRAEIIDYNGFKVTLSAGGKVGAHKIILLHIAPRREIFIMADRMRVFFRNEQIGYDILDDGNPTEKSTFTAFHDEMNIVYSLEVNGTFGANDSLLFFAPGIFQAGERFYNLDTLVFKLPW
jgi:hypothetical protein